LPSNPDAPGSLAQLRKEATFAETMFKQAVLESTDEGLLKFERACPFKLDEEESGEGEKKKREVAPVAYRYRRWHLYDNLDVVVRSEVGALLNDGKKMDETWKDNIVTFCTLNETNKEQTAWQKNLLVKRGTVLSDQLTQNITRVTRAFACAVLVGAKQFSLAFLTRFKSASADRHQALSVASYDTTSFYKQINLTERKLWGVADRFFRVFAGLEAGHDYVVVKDGEKANMTIYLTDAEKAEENLDE